MMTHQHRRSRRRTMATLVKQGDSPEAVARNYRVGLTTVLSACREFGVCPPRRPTAPRVRVFRVLFDLLHGKHQSVVAAEYRVSPQYVNEIAARARAAGFTLPAGRRGRRSRKTG